MHVFAGIENINYYNPEINILYCGFDKLEKWDFPNLGAPFWRIYYNFSEGGVVIRNKKELKMVPGKIYMISPDTEYGARLTRPFEHFYIHFQTASPYNFCPDKIYVFDAKEEDLKLIEEICKFRQAGSEHRRELSLRILAMCLRGILEIPENDLKKSYSDRRVIRAVEFIEKNLRKAISNDDLAKLFGMNRNAFAKIFRENVGVSPQKFIAQRRIQQACLLLRFSDLTVDEIAEMTGFCDRYYFTRVFTQQRNIPPAAFRRLAH